MAPSTPWIATCATAAVSGLLALATGTTTAPAASPLPTVPSSVSGSAAAGTSAQAARGAHGSAAAKHAGATGVAHAADRSAPGRARALLQHDAAAAQRMRIAGASSSEDLVRRTGSRGSGSVDQLKLTSFSALRSATVKKVAGISMMNGV